MESEVNIKKSIVEIQHQLDELTFSLREEKLMPFRVLAALLCTYNYNTIYKRLVKGWKGKVKGQGRPTVEEQTKLADWELNNPHLANALKDRKITPRAWCCAHNYLTSDGKADLNALFNQAKYEKETGRPAGAIRHNLELDFPKIYNISYPKYVALDCEIDNYCKKKLIKSKGKLIHCLSVPALSFSIYHSSLLIARQLFVKRFYQELRIVRMQMLLKIEGVLTAEHIKTALNWLPPEGGEVRDCGVAGVGEGRVYMAIAGQLNKYYKNLPPPVFA